MAGAASAMPMLSVVIIGRNEASYIERCIASVLAATSALPACEVVYVDSCSTDETVHLARRFPIRVIELSGQPRCCPAMGRHVGTRLTQGEYVLCVDGDTEIAPQWVSAALAQLTGRPELGGIAGREHQIYYHDGAVVGEKADYFGDAAGEHAVKQFGGNALYRRRALERVGSFNPLVRSFEEAELGARLRHAGWQLVRIPQLMGYHHTQQPDSVSEYWRRVRGHLFTGHGQVLRLALGHGLFWEHARQLNRVLALLAWTIIGVVLLLGSVLLQRGWPMLVWCGASALLLTALVIRARSVAKPARLLLDWAACAVPLVWGFVAVPANPSRFDLRQAIAGDTAADASAPPARLGQSGASERISAGGP